MKARQDLRLRCLKTGNPPGTDTIMIGHACTCQVCEAAHEIARLREQLDIARLALNSPMLGGIPP
jgi:hypothetical protein